MNNYQELWWRQARSDYEILTLLRSHGAAPCHQLHYLQMVTEKLAKAYFWRSGNSPTKKHTGFVQYLRSMGSVQQAARQQITSILAFRSYAEFQTWIKTILPLAYDLERLAPALAQDGPNPEYPWPHKAPTHAPVQSHFAVWEQLSQTGRGRQLTQVIHLALEKFPAYG